MLGGWRYRFLPTATAPPEGLSLGLAPIPLELKEATDPGVILAPPQDAVQFNPLVRQYFCKLSVHVLAPRPKSSQASNITLIAQIGILFLVLGSGRTAQLHVGWKEEAQRLRREKKKLLPSQRNAAALSTLIS